MPVAPLSPQQLTSSDEECGHAVAQSVLRRPWDLGGAGQLGEPVPESARREPDVVGGLGGEQAGAEGGAVGKPPHPVLGARSPQLRRLPSDGEPPGPTGLGGPQHVGRHTPFDGEHPPLEVVETQGDQLASPRPRVRCEAGQQADLFGLVQAFLIKQSCRADRRIGGSEKAQHLLGTQM